MLELGVHLATVFCLVVLLSSQSSANSRRSTSLPSDPNDPYYKTYQNVPSASVTAAKLMTNFLHLHTGIFSRHKRQYYIEDIVIVMDGSESVGSCEFGKARKAITYMMALANRFGRDTKYAAVTFATSANINFKFLPYATAANEIMKISFPDGATNTQAGLMEAKNLFDDPSSVYVLLSKKLVFLVTDGHSNVKPHLTFPKPNALKNSGVEIFVVAVGKDINGIDEMVKVASYPPEHFLFRIEKLSSFWEIVKLVIKRVSPGKYDIINERYDPPC